MTQTQHPLAGLLKECPEFFFIRTVNGHSYYVPNYVTWEIKRAMEKADQEAYRAAKPEECKPDIDFTKFNLWVTSNEGENVTNTAEARVLFIPKDDAPEVNVRKMPLLLWNEARNFFERPLPNNSYAPTDATVSAAKVENESAVTPSA